MACLVAAFPACKKSPGEMLEGEKLRASRSQLNKKIADLHGRLDRADNDFRRAEIHTGIASLHDEKGDYAASGKSSRQAIKYQPNQHLSHYLLGKSYLAADRLDEAGQELILSIELDDSFAPAHFELGNVYYRRARYTEALASYHAAVRHDPGHYMAHNNTGVILSLLGNQRGALNSFEKAAAARPGFPQPYKNMGIIHDLYLKEPEQAIARYRRYLELRPNSQDRRLVRSWIEVLGGRQ
jgi:tetratricopeptide (TPR) repeat protein